MADNSSSESSLISVSDYLDFETSIENENNETADELVRWWWFEPPKHYQPKIERKSQKTIKFPFPAVASIKKATNCECITLINKVLFKISCSLNTLDTIAAYFHQLEIGEG